MMNIMTMEIPYFKQETEWTCGPAVMRMILASFGIQKTEEELAMQLETNTEKGTWYGNLLKLAEIYGFRYLSDINGTLSDLKNLTKEGFKVIVCYYCPEEDTDHYAVVKGIDSDFIYLLDPWYGPDYSVSLSEFINMWKNDPKYSDVKGWYAALKK